MTNCVQLLQHVDLLHADGGLGFQKEFDYIQAATVEKKGSYDDGGDGDGGGANQVTVELFMMMNGYKDDHQGDNSRMLSS